MRLTFVRGKNLPLRPPPSQGGDLRGREHEVLIICIHLVLSQDARRDRGMDSMATVSFESRVRRKPDIPWKQLEGTIVVLDLTSGDFFELDEIGSRIWLGLDGARSLADLAGDLAREYDAPLDQIGSDIIAFVSDLNGRALVTIG